MMHSSGQHHQRRSHHPEEDNVDDDEEAAAAAAALFRTSGGGRRVGSGVRATTSSSSSYDEADRPRRRPWWSNGRSYDTDDVVDTMLRGGGNVGLWADEDRQKQRRPNFKCWGLVLSLLVWIVLMALSGIHEEWTLHAGESRRVETPILQKRIVVASRDKALDAVVYDLEGDCPPLTGRPVTLKDSRSMTLGVNEFQYDSFFLNAGSVISLTIETTQGNPAAYIVQGSNALKRLQSPSTDDDPFGKDIVAQGTASLGKSSIFNYTVVQSDIYALVYDNPLAVASSCELTATYTVAVTTYQLKQFLPMCNSLKMNCEIDRPSRGGCLLVQAERKPRSSFVTLQVNGRRRWLPILIYSILPYLICMALARIFRPKSTYHAVDLSSGNDEDRPDNNETPPPAPSSTEMVTILPDAQQQAVRGAPISDPRWDKKGRT